MVKRICIAFIMATILNSCSNISNGANAIPKTATFVSVLDVKSVIQKAKFDDKEELEKYGMYRKMERLLKKDRNLSKMFEEIIEDPQATGIDLYENVFFYHFSPIEKSNYICSTFSISDEDDFKDFLKKILKSSNTNFDIEKEKEFDYEYIVVKPMHPNIIIGWNHNKAVVISRISSSYSYEKKSKDKKYDELLLTLEDVMTLKDDDKITTVDSFNDFYSDKKDLSVWISSSNIKDMTDFNRANGISSTWLLNEASNFDATINLEFTDKAISFTSNIFPDDEDAFKKYTIYGEDFNTKLLKHLPKKNISVSSTTFNMDRFNRLIKEFPFYSGINREFQKELNITVEDFIKSIGGSLALNFYGFEVKEQTYLTYGYKFFEEEAQKLDSIAMSSVKEILQGKYRHELEEKIEELNKGMNVKIDYSGTSINIKNVLANGGDYKSAVADNVYVNRYEGGINYGKYIEKTEETPVGLFAVIMDVANPTVFNNINKVLDKMTENGIAIKKDNYYAFSQRFPLYILNNGEMVLFTSDINLVKEFKLGARKESLADSDIASKMEANKFYAYTNFDRTTYPKELNKLIDNELPQQALSVINIWSEFAKDIELVSQDYLSSEYRIHTKKTDENSLYQLLKIIDKLIIKKLDL